MSSITKKRPEGRLMAVREEVVGRRPLREIDPDTLYPVPLSLAPNSSLLESVTDINTQNTSTSTSTSNSTDDPYRFTSRTLSVPDRMKEARAKENVNPAGTELFASNRVGDYAALAKQGDRFALLQTCHASLFGSIKLALDRSTGQRVCIKISALSHMTRSVTLASAVLVFEAPRVEAKLLREITQLAKTDPRATHIIGFIDELEDKMAHYLITEYAAGGDLYHLLCSPQWRDVEFAPILQRRELETQAKSIFIQISLALSLLHYRRIAHRDVSIENIVITEHKVVKLIDLGLSINVDSPKAKLKPQIQVGKTTYISREAFNMEENIDWCSNDIYSMGIVLYSLLVGRPPYFFPQESDALFRSVYSGAWLLQPDDLTMSFAAARLIDSCIKPQSRRATWSTIWNSEWLRAKETEEGCNGW